MSDEPIEWTAQPIPPSGRKSALENQRSFAKITDKLHATARRFCWWVAGASNLSTLICLAILGVVLYREKPQPPMFIALYPTMAGLAYDAVPAKDAVKLFDASMRQDDVDKYIRARIGYVDVEDHEQWATVHAMSGPDCWLEYDAWRKSPLSPKQMLNTNGYVTLSDWVDDAHPVHSVQDDVWTYTVTVKTQQVRGREIQTGRTPWRITLAFRYVPDMTMRLEDRQRNRRGFQCLNWRQDPL